MTQRPCMESPRRRGGRPHPPRRMVLRRYLRGTGGGLDTQRLSHRQLAFARERIRGNCIGFEIDQRRVVRAAACSGEAGWGERIEICEVDSRCGQHRVVRQERVDNGPEQLKQLLTQGADRFAEAFVEQLATYALLRVLTIDDAPLIKAIAAARRNEDYRLDAVIQNLMPWPLFQQR